MLFRPRAVCTAPRPVFRLLCRAAHRVPRVPRCYAAHKQGSHFYLRAGSYWARRVQRPASGRENTAHCVRRALCFGGFSHWDVKRNYRASPTWKQPQVHVCHIVRCVLVSGRIHSACVIQCVPVSGWVSHWTRLALRLCINEQMYVPCVRRPRVTLCSPQTP